MAARNKVDRKKWEQRLARLGIVPHKMPQTLTEAELDAVRTHPPGGRHWLPDGKVPGMYLGASEGNAASLLLRFRTTAGVRRNLKHCTVGAMTLEQARRNAKEHLAAVGRDGDPLAEREAARVEVESVKTVRSYLEDLY